MEVNDYRSSFQKNGFISPVDIIDVDQVFSHRKKLEEAEDVLGSLHYKSKVHTIIKSAYELASNTKMLDMVETILGDNILLYNVTYIYIYKRLF